MIVKYKPQNHTSLLHEVERRLTALEQPNQIRAKTLSVKGRPKLNDAINPYVETIHYSHQQILDFINSELHAETTRYQVGLTRQSTDKEQEALQQQFQNLHEKKEAIAIQLEHTPKPEKLTYRFWSKVVIACLLLLEGFFAISSFVGFGFPLLIAILAGLIIAVCLTAFSDTALKIITEGKTNKQRKIIAIVLGALLIGFFYHLASLRTTYMFNDTGIVYSPLHFIIISLFIFTVAVAISRYYLPNTIEQQSISRYNKLVSELKKLHKEIQRLTKEVHTATTASQQTNIAGASHIETGAMLEEKVMHHAYTTWSEFKTANLDHRNDGITPNCFSEPYPCTFKRYFQFNNQNNNNHENTSTHSTDQTWV